MSEGRKWRVVPVSYDIISTLLLVWAVLTVPAAAIEAITNVTQWDGVIITPTDYFGRKLGAFAAHVPLLSGLPAWTVRSLYLVLLVAGVAWYYWSNIVAARKRQFELASTGSLGSVEPIEANPSGVELSVAVGGLGAVGVGTAMLNAATAGAFLGPPGVAFGLMAGGLAAFVLGTIASAKRESEARAHAEKQTKILEERRVLLIHANIEHFTKRELRKLVTATAIATMIIVANFVAPLIYNALHTTVR